MWVCNTGLDCEQCPGCDSQLEWEDDFELSMMEKAMDDYNKILEEKIEKEKVKKE